MEADQQPFNNICKANGCPLAVSVVTHWYDQESKKEARRPRWGVCAYHRAADGSDWIYVTRQLNEHIETLQLFARVQSLTDVNLKPIAGESVALWLSRVNEYHKSVILPGATQSATDTGQRLQELMHSIQSNSLTCLK